MREITRAPTTSAGFRGELCTSKARVSLQSVCLFGRGCFSSERLNPSPQTSLEYAKDKRQVAHARFFRTITLLPRNNCSRLSAATNPPLFPIPPLNPSPLFQHVPNHHVSWDPPECWGESDPSVLALEGAAAAEGELSLGGESSTGPGGSLAPEGPLAEQLSR